MARNYRSNFRSSSGKLLSGNLTSIFVLVILSAGFGFIGLSLIINIDKAILVLAICISVVMAFIPGEFLIYILILAFCFPVPLKVSGITIFNIDLIILLMVVSVALKASKEKRLDTPPHFYIIICTAFVSTMILSSFNARNIATALPEIMQIFYYLLIIPFIIMNIVRGSARVMMYLRIFSFLILLEAALIILQSHLAASGNGVISQLFPWANKLQPNEETIVLRSFGSIGPGVGFFLGFAIVILLSEIIRNRKAIMKQLYGVIGIFASLYALACTGIRSMGVLSVVLLTVFAFFRKKYLMAVIMASTFLIIAFVALNLGKDIYPFSLYYGHSGTRSIDAQQALAEFQRSPLTVLIGVGPHQFLRQRPWGEFAGVENESIKQLVEGGVIAFTSFFIWILTPVVLGLYTSRKTKVNETRDAGAILAFTFLFYTVCAFISVDIFEGGHGHFMVVIAGLIFSVYEEYRNEDKAALKTGYPQNYSAAGKRVAQGGDTTVKPAVPKQSNSRIS